jgi:hypothetical protein
MNLIPPQTLVLVLQLKKIKDNLEKNFNENGPISQTPYRNYQHFDGKLESAETRTLYRIPKKK